MNAARPYAGVLLRTLRECQGDLQVGAAMLGMPMIRFARLVVEARLSGYARVQRLRAGS